MMSNPLKMPPRRSEAKEYNSGPRALARRYAFKPKTGTFYKKRYPARRMMTARKKTYRSKFKRMPKNSHMRTQVARSIQPFWGDRIFVKLRANYANALASAGGGYQQQSYAHNDPYNGSGSAVPSGWNLLWTYYSQAICHGAKYTVRITNQSGSTPVGLALGTLFTAVSPSGITSGKLFFEQPYSSHHTLDTSPDQKTITRYMSTRKLLGEKSLQHSDFIVKTVSSSPNIITSFVVCGFALDGSTSYKFYVDVTVDYYMEFWQRKIDPSTFLSKMDEACKPTLPLPDEAPESPIMIRVEEKKAPPPPLPTPSPMPPPTPHRASSRK